MNDSDSLIPDPRWFQAPNERTPRFFLTYSQVSIAVQEALREMAPAEFFADLSQFKNERAAYAMLAYAASRPFRPKSRTDFTYDVTNATAMMTFYRFSRRKLIAGLGEAHARLVAAGHDDLAQLYDPWDLKYMLKAVKKKRSRKPLHRLLLAEGKLVNELTGFSGLDAYSPKEQKKETGMIVKRWRSTLRNLCLGIDLSSLAAPLFEVATNAYLNVNQPESVSEPELWDELLDLAA